MCNLYSNTTVPEAMRNVFQVQRRFDFLGNSEPLFSIFPGHAAPIVRLADGERRELAPSRFGFLLPQLSKRTGKPILPKSVANARMEKLQTSTFWRQSFQQRRCLVPASAFCETKGRRPAVHYWFGVTGDAGLEPFAFAGLWRKFSGRYRDEQSSFATHAIVTTTPNTLVREVHPARMPVILDASDHEAWLTGTPEEASALLRPFPAERMRVIASGAGMTSADFGREVPAPD